MNQLVRTAFKWILLILAGIVIVAGGLYTAIYILFYGW